MTKPIIKTVTPLKTDEIVGAVVLAFSADPAARWLYPDPHEYLMNFPSFVRTFAREAFEHKSVYYVETYLGVALWLPPEVHPDEERLVALLRRTVRKPGQADVFRVLEQMNGYHPREPHWYLPMIGVDPAHQQKGYGSALMRQALAVCDREKRLAYLESSSPKNIPFYERHGFELVGTIQIGSSPPIFPMVRQPCARSDKI